MAPRYNQNSQKDISTDRIEAIAESAVRKASGEHKQLPCDDHGRRICQLEETARDHSERLGQGDVGFAEMRKDIHSLTEKIGTLTTAAYWLIGVLVLGVLSTGGTVMVWVLGHMGGGKP